MGQLEEHSHIRVGSEFGDVGAALLVVQLSMESSVTPFFALANATKDSHKCKPLREHDNLRRRVSSTTVEPFYDLGLGSSSLDPASEDFISRRGTGRPDGMSSAVTALYALLHHFRVCAGFEFCQECCIVDIFAMRAARTDSSMLSSPSSRSPMCTVALIFGAQPLRFCLISFPCQSLPQSCQSLQAPTYQRSLTEASRGELRFPAPHLRRRPGLYACTFFCCEIWEVLLIACRRLIKSFSLQKVVLKDSTGQDPSETTDKVVTGLRGARLGVADLVTFIKNDSEPSGLVKRSAQGVVFIKEVFFALFLWQTLRPLNFGPAHHDIMPLDMDSRGSRSVPPTDQEVQLGQRSESCICCLFLYLDESVLATTHEASVDDLVILESCTHAGNSPVSIGSWLHSRATYEILDSFVDSSGVDGGRVVPTSTPSESFQCILSSGRCLESRLTFSLLRFFDLPALFCDFEVRAFFFALKSRFFLLYADSFFIKRSSSSGVIPPLRFFLR
ncbi:hypothetical protein KCU66_g2, partial [Aureobasidium melanogenum]